MRLLMILLVLSLLACGMNETLADTDLPADDQYVVARGERLYLGEKHVRFWGLVCAVAGNTHVTGKDSPETVKTKVEANQRGMDRFAERLGDMGFNMVRFWDGRYGRQKETLPLLYEHDYTVGDGSDSDTIAYALYAMDKAGIKIWMSSTNGLGWVSPEDVDIIDDPDTADAWKQAVSELAASTRDKKFLIRRHGWGWLAAAIDERVEAIMIDRLRKFTNFPNKYKGGMRLGDDPQIVVWEISNEHFPHRHFFYGHWQKLPAFFQKKLLRKWSTFLKTKYETDKALRDAWGFLLPGESLDKPGSIMLVPLAQPMKGSPVLNDTNPAIIESLKTKIGGYGREDFNRRRGEDVVAFANELIIGHKERVEEALHTMGKSCRLSPTVLDSGNSFRVQSSYMHQFGDATSTCSYTKGMGHDPNDKRFPFYSQLDDSPRTSWGVPWLEQSSNLDQPTFVYETNIDNRTKYRAEYPLRVAALGSIQDWSIVCWHTYPGRDKQTNGKAGPFFDQRVNCGGDYFTIRGDEVYLAALRAGGAIFTNTLVDPAPDPVVFTFGRKTLLDPDSMDYGKSYGDFRHHFIGTAYRYGCRVKIDPTQEEDTVSGRHTIRPNVFESNPVKPNDEITYDWQRAFLKMDSPGCASYTGFFGEYGRETVGFNNNDVTFTDISFSNPQDIAYPVTPEEGYCTLTLASCDDKPLAETARAVFVPASTSFNAGYRLDLTRSNQGGQRSGPKDVPPQEHWGAWTEGGKGATLVVRVGVTVKSSAINGMTYVMRDFQMNELSRGTVTDGTLVVPADRDVWYVELSRN